MLFGFRACLFIGIFTRKASNMVEAVTVVANRMLFNIERCLEGAWYSVVTDLAKNESELGWNIFRNHQERHPCYITWLSLRGALTGADLRERENSHAT